MSKEKTWGDVIYTDGQDEEEEDPIAVLIQKFDDLKNSPIKWKEGETKTQAEERRKLELYAIEKEIWDKIYIKRQKALGS